MLIIGEKINTSCVVNNLKVVETAVIKRDVEFIEQLAISQFNAGASYIDLNCGTLLNDEPEAMAWMVNVVQSATPAMVSIDSHNFETVNAGLRVCDLTRGKPIINSITADKDHYENILPMVLKYKSKVIAMAIDGKVLKYEPGQRLNIIINLVDDLLTAGVAADDIYIDPLIFPVATKTESAEITLQLIKEIRNLYYDVHITAGISNTSFGLPARKYINSAMIILAMEYGLDTAIFDPCDDFIMHMVKSASVILGKDENCADYLSFCRGIRL